MPFGAIGHSDAIATGNNGVGGIAIGLASAASSHYREAGKHGFNFTAFLVQYVSAIAFDIRHQPGDVVTQMVLRNQVNRKIMLQYLQVGQLAGLG